MIQLIRSRIYPENMEVLYDRPFSKESIAEAYNDVKTQNEDLSAFLDELPNLLAEAVSEAIIEQEAAEAALNPVEEEAAEPEVVVVVTKVKTTDVVNVRSSDSIEADKIGRTTKGQVLELVEERVNGWSKVIFENKEGFIKTEFLQPEETEMQLSTEVSENDSVAGVATTSDITTKKGTVTDTVNVRKTSSTDGTIVGILNKDSDIEIIEQMSNGWTKIKHSSGEAYVKSDFVKVEGVQSQNNSETSDKEDSEETAAVTTKKGKVTDTVNVRKTSSTDGTVVGILNKGTQIEIIEQMSNGWTKIKHSSGEAYVKSDYVEVQ